MKDKKIINANILIAEDEGLVATDIKMTLESYGYDVCSIAATGEEALLKCKEERPGLVLMDIMLAGELDGIETAGRIKRLYDIPVVYLTAYSDEALLNRAKKTEPFGYLIKPFSERELHSTIEMAIYNHSITRKLQESDAWLKTTMRSIGDGVIATDTDGNIKFMNPVAQYITGWSEDDALGNPLQEILKLLNEETGGEDSLFLEKVFGEVMQGGKPASISTHIMRKNGDRIFISDSAAPIVDSNNRTLGMVLTFSDITEKKRLDEKMGRSEERYRLLFDLLPFGGEVLDKEGFIVDCSTKNAELFGYEREEMIGKKITEFLSLESRAVFHEKFPLLRQGKPVQAVVSMVRKDKRLIDVERTARPLFDPEGNFSGVLALNVDITERKKMEQELLKYEHIVSSCSEHMSFIDRDYVYRTVNETYLKAHHKKRDEIIGHSVADLLTQEVFDGFVKERLDRCLGGETVNYETWFNFPALGRRYMDVKYYPFRDIKGIIAGAVVVARDITERKLMEDALHESEETLRGVFNGSHDGILMADAETRRFYLGNDRICRMLGYSLEELKDLRVDDIHPVEDVPDVVEGFNRTSAEDISLIPGLRVKRKDGSIFLADIGSSIVNLRQRKYLIGMFRDVTERRQMEEELKKYSRDLEKMVKERTAELEKKTIQAEAANRAKSEFLGNMSHELRTPLNAIIGFSEIMADGSAGPLTEQQKDYLNDVIESSHHLLLLINDILDMAKMEADKMELVLSSFPLCDILMASMTMHKGKAKNHNIDLSCDIDPDTDIEITADEKKIKQVMFNLLSNAIKFTPDVGSVRVSARRIQNPESKIQEKECIEISVADTGIGIERGDRGKLFQLFSQADQSTTKKYAGAGVGLSLCKNFVELHGGRIWFESEVGKGSRFTFTIPLKQS